MEQLFVATLPSPIAWHFILGFLENSNVDVTDVTTVYCSRSILEVGRESCIPDRQTGPGTATGATSQLSSSFGSNFPYFFKSMFGSLQTNYQWHI